jgi:hypothetical protein
MSYLSTRQFKIYTVLENLMREDGEKGDRAIPNIVPFAFTLGGVAN